MEKKRFKITALGCRTNQYEAQAFRDQLLSLGYEEALGEEEADLCIVNTCTVTKSADERSRHQIRSLNREHPEAKIFVTGCMTEKQSPTILGIQGVAGVVKNKDKENLLNIAFPDMEIPEFKIERFEAHTRAFVKVQDGCNSFCSYCIIPYVRGRSRSRRLTNIIEEVVGLVKNGFHEVVLTGINIGDYDGAPLEGEEPVRLSQLTKAVAEVPGVRRLRISSIDPDEVDDELIEVIKQNPNCCQSMHIVLQSGSNTVLKRMRRKYTVQQFFDTIDRLKSHFPEFTYTTDIILGFPGETQEEFEETLEVMRRVGFLKVHMFPYSKREGTLAARMPGHLEPAVVHERKELLLAEAEKTAFEQREPYVGQLVEVLVEAHNHGHTNNFIPVQIEGSLVERNQFATVKILENQKESLVGVVVSI
ncbi:MAG: tRNA (N(6)-L-threonylcarbamoyladenosine(37)-C(2))-methylthiotransferase MtaB [Chlamydiia bacterium]